jgi:hypothetical protein
MTTLFQVTGIKLGLDKVSAEAQEILFDGALTFLQAGGTLSLADWAGLSPVERAAFAKAGEVTEVRRAIRSGACSRSVEEATKVYSSIDGGQALAQMVTDMGAALVRREASKEPIA